MSLDPLNGNFEGIGEMSAADMTFDTMCLCRGKTSLGGQNRRLAVVSVSGMFGVPPGTVLEEYFLRKTNDRSGNY